MPGKESSQVKNKVLLGQTLLEVTESENDPTPKKS